MERNAAEEGTETCFGGLFLPAGAQQQKDPSADSRTGWRIDHPESLPDAAKNNRIFSFGKKDWILSQQEKASARLAEHPRHTFCQGETVYFLGKPLHIMIKDGNFPPYRKKGDLILSSERPEAQAVEWFREQAKGMLTPRVAELAKQYGFSFSGVRITSAKGRYGSCNHKNGINLSWRIVMAPLETVDAVILHELCHTTEHNHSSRFWTLLSSVCPDYDGCCRWLREHGLELVSFG